MIYNSESGHGVNTSKAFSLFVTRKIRKYKKTPFPSGGYRMSLIDGYDESGWVYWRSYKTLDAAFDAIRDYEKDDFYINFKVVWCKFHPNKGRIYTDLEFYEREDECCSHWKQRTKHYSVVTTKLIYSDYDYKCPKEQQVIQENCDHLLLARKFKHQLKESGEYDSVNIHWSTYDYFLGREITDYKYQ